MKKEAPDMRKLQNKSQQELVNELANLKTKEAHVLADILIFLDEVAHRKLHLELGYQSIYKFCFEKLGYTKDEAYTRMRASELVHLGIESAVRENKLGLTALAQARIAFRKHKAPRDQQKQILTKIIESKNACKTIADAFPADENDRDLTKPLGKNRNLIQFEVTDEELELLQRLKNHQAHKNYDGKWHDLFMDLARNEVVKHEKPAKPFVQNESAKSSKRIYISVQIDRKIRERANYQCEYVSPDGHRCSSTHGIQVDHIIPLACGGTNEFHNFRLLCGEHNRFEAERWGLNSPRAGWIYT